MSLDAENNGGAGIVPVPTGLDKQCQLWRRAQQIASLCLYDDQMQQSACYTSKRRRIDRLSASATVSDRQGRDIRWPRRFCPPVGHFGRIPCGIYRVGQKGGPQSVGDFFLNR